MTPTWERYAAGWRDLHGGYDPRTGSVFVRGWLRLAYTLGSAVARAGATPSAVTTVGLALSVGVPLAARLPVLAAALVLLSAVADSVDGAVAVLTGRASRAGQMYDALADRVGEACWLVALWLLGAPGWLLVACGGLSWLHEYARALVRAAGLADIGTVTVAERPTRVILVVLALVTPVTTVVLSAWAILAAAGLGQLLTSARKRLR